MALVATRSRSEVVRLEAEKQAVLEEVEHLQIEMHNMAEPSADEADVDAYEREKTWALIRSLQHKLEAIDHALQLAQSGTYGICQNCGVEIDPARLEILPQATLCLKCQREYERRYRHATP